MAESNSTNIADPESVLTLALSDIAAIADLLAMQNNSVDPDEDTITQAGNMIRKSVKDAQEVVNNYVRYEQPKADGGAA